MAFIRPISFVLFLFLANVASANTLQDLSFAELPGGKLEMRATFSQPPEQPESYAIDSPARIVIDFSSVDSQIDQKKFQLGFGVAQSALVLSSDNRTRVIVNLTNSAPYETRVEGNAVVTVIGNSTPGASPAATSTNSTGTTTVRNFGARVNSLQDVDFRRDPTGAGKVIVSLSSNANATVRQNSKGVEISFLNTEIPDALRRRLDVNDFGTPVNSIESFKDGRNTKIVIKASGTYDYLAYQSDNQYILSVKPLTAKEIEDKRKKFAFKGQRISLNFQDIEVRAVLKIIAEFTNLNMVVSDTVSGSITLKLDDVPWDQALDLVLKTKGLDKRQTGSVIYVAPAVEIAEREQQELENELKRQQLAPLRTENFRVKYANAMSIYTGLFKDNETASGSGNNEDDDDKRSFLSPRGQAIVDERTNTIIMTDIEEKIEEFRDILDQIDVPVRQVMIESRIVIANTDFRKELGIRIAGDGSHSRNGHKFEATGRLEGLVNNDGQGPEGVFIDSDGDGISDDERDLVSSNLVDLGVAGAAGSLALNILTDNILLGLELSALESSGYAEIVSQPKVITGDKQQASIESGQEIAFTVVSQDGANVQFKEAKLKLDVTPQITPDNRVIMTLKINQDSIGEVETTTGIPTIDVTELNTQVLVGDGQTVVLGGIFQVSSVTGQTKVPLLGDIPGVGRLFRNDIKREDKQELLIFITPKILSDTLVE